MLETVEATIDPLGNVKLVEKIRLDRQHRAIVTILDALPEQSLALQWSLAGSMELIDEDLEAASREIAEEMNRAIEHSAEDLRKSYE